MKVRLVSLISLALLVIGALLLAPAFEPVQILGLVLVVVSLTVHEHAAIAELQDLSSKVNEDLVEMSEDFAKLGLHHNRQTSFLNKLVVASENAEKLAREADKEFFEDFSEDIEHFKTTFGSNPFGKV